MGRKRPSAISPTEFVNPDFDKIAQAYTIEVLIDPANYPTTPKTNLPEVFTLNNLFGWNLREVYL
jgi:hypothetical protein